MVNTLGYILIIYCLFMLVMCITGLVCIYIEKLNYLAPKIDKCLLFNTYPLGVLVVLWFLVTVLIRVV